MSGLALVTGAAKRIGREIALELARRGWDVVVHYHTSGSEAESTARAIQSLGRQAYLAEIDLSDTKLVEKLIPQLTEALGPLNALVNNASLFESDATDPGGTRHTAINTTAPQILSEAFHTHATGGIVHILDAYPNTPTFSAYNHSKIALADSIPALAARFTPRVRVNGLAIGPTLINPRQSVEHFAQRAAATARKTATPPREVSQAVAALLTGHKSGEIQIL